MSVVAAREMHWTEAEYLSMEAKSPIKHEYFDGEIFAMVGAKPHHNLVATNMLGLLHALLRGRPCRAFNSDQRIYVPATGLYTYPDGGVVCGKMQFHPGDPDMSLVNPALLFEVLSSSTRDDDRGSKREHYQAIPSLRHILLIDQPTRLVEHHRREPGGAWDLSTIRTGAIRLPDLGGVIPLDDLYLLDEAE